MKELIFKLVVPAMLIGVLVMHYFAYPRLPAKAKPGWLLMAVGSVVLLCDFVEIVYLEEVGTGFNAFGLLGGLVFIIGMVLFQVARIRK